MCAAQCEPLTWSHATHITSCVKEYLARYAEFEPTLTPNVNYSLLDASIQKLLENNILAQLLVVEQFSFKSSKVYSPARSGIRQTGSSVVILSESLAGFFIVTAVIAFTDATSYSLPFGQGDAEQLLQDLLRPSFR